MDPLTRVTERLAHNSWGLLGSQGHVLGIDLGSYGLRAALIDLQAHTITTLHRALPDGDPHTQVAAGIALGRALMEQSGVPIGHLVRVAVGFSGPVDASRGLVIRAPRRSGWDQYPLKNAFEQAFDTVTLVENDANLIAVGEATFGAGHGMSNLFYLHLSSGVGGGLVLDGRLYHGSTFMAGEIGHAVATAGTHSTRTLEQTVSIGALLEQAAALGLHTDDLEVLLANREVGERVIGEAVAVLAARLSQICALLDPQLVVLGGILIRLGGEPLLDQIRAGTRRLRSSDLDRDVPITASVLGPDSVAIGALAVALESLRE